VFDRFVVVDWSARSTPMNGADSIWIGIEDATGTRSCNPRTRAEAADVLDGLVDGATADRTLIGVDFSLGHPAGTADALDLDLAAPWRSTWDLLADLVVDEPNNRNNRFEVAALLNERMTGGIGPYWGCPPSARSVTLASTKPPVGGSLPEWRCVETRLRAQGRRPFSAWQLLGAGAVGSQTVLGIPRLARLVDRLGGDRAAVWPFTTGLVAPVCVPGSVVIAEVWPSMLPIADDSRRVRDQVQVETAVAWLATCARSGTLSAMFNPRVDADEAGPVVAEEGWVLGVV
jgi:precorrin-8X/cobalt-precorrin-8 methylmutase